jgi:hypothetical protein
MAECNTCDQYLSDSDILRKLITCIDNEYFLKINNQNPDSINYISDSILDTINVIAGTHYYLMNMNGYKDLSITGKFIDVDSIITMTLEATNDEDTTNADWIQVYGYDSKNDIMTNSIICSSETTTFAWDFDNLNYSYFRIKVINTDNTNTMIIKIRRKSL